MSVGQIAIDVGHHIAAQDLGLLANFRRGTLTVFQRPRVTILTTGDELVDIHEAAAPGTIVNSNAYMLSALVREYGGLPTIFPNIADDRVETRRAFQAAISVSDLVISAGGVSVGDHDHVRDVLDDLCGGIEFWKVRMKPGKPLAFGLASSDGTPIIGLPGNPVSSFVAFHQFARPAIAKLQGSPRERWFPRRIRARVVDDFEASRSRLHFVTGTLGFDDGDPTFEAYRDQSSGNLAAISGIDALALVPAGQASVAAASLIEVDVL